MAERQGQHTALKLLLILLLHSLVFAALIGALGVQWLDFVLFAMMGFDEALLCGSTGKVISKWIFDTEEAPGLARVVLFLVYLVVFFLCLMGPV